MLGVINYGAGNYGSLCNALNFIEIPFKEIQKAEDFDNVSRIILPGVGAFNHCMNRLKIQGILERLKDEIINENKLFLGICVGHQVLATIGTEFDVCEGLNLINGKVIKLESSKKMPVPNIGWSEVFQNKDSPLFEGIKNNATFYFVHSYYLETEDKAETLATINYGSEITAAANRGNIFGVQFHPEKSQKNGLKVLKNFSEMNL